MRISGIIVVCYLCVNLEGCGSWDEVEFVKCGSG